MIFRFLDSNINTNAPCLTMLFLSLFEKRHNNCNRMLSNHEQLFTFRRPISYVVQGGMEVYSPLPLPCCIPQHGGVTSYPPLSSSSSRTLVCCLLLLRPLVAAAGKQFGQTRHSKFQPPSALQYHRTTIPPIMYVRPSTHNSHRKACLRIRMPSTP